MLAVALFEIFKELNQGFGALERKGVVNAGPNPADAAVSLNPTESIRRSVRKKFRFERSVVQTKGDIH